jgi:Mg-chelatase subunit ChlD
MTSERSDASRNTQGSASTPPQGGFDIRRKDSSRPEGTGWAYLLVDCSVSMDGSKFEQAKRGAAGFARDAIEKGYATGLIEFYWSAAHLSEPTRDMTTLANNIGRLKIKKVGLGEALGSLFHKWGGGTNMAEGIRLAHERLMTKTGTKAIVIITDGQPNAEGDPDRSLRAGESAKKDRIDIITIGTDQADQQFLKKLASRADLGMKVDQENLQDTIISSVNLLSSGR